MFSLGGILGIHHPTKSQPDLVGGAWPVGCVTECPSLVVQL